MSAPSGAWDASDAREPHPSASEWKYMNLGDWRGQHSRRWSRELDQDPSEPYDKWASMGGNIRPHLAKSGKT
jgi:hypothetical protein